MHRLHIIVLQSHFGTFWPLESPRTKIVLIGGFCFSAGFFSWVTVIRKKVGGRRDHNKNGDQKKEHIGIAPVPQFSRNTFPKHYEKTHCCFLLCRHATSTVTVCVVAPQLARQLHQEHTRWCAVIGKPRSPRLEGTPAMDLELKGIRTHMETDKREIAQNTHP